MYKEAVDRAASTDVPGVVKVAPFLVAKEVLAAMSVAPCKVTVPVPEVKLLVPATVTLPFRVLAPVEVWKLPVELWASKLPAPAAKVKFLPAATVVSPLRLTVPVPVAKVPELADWSKLPLAKLRPVAPVIAPVLDMSMLVVSRAKVPAPPPI